jgi:subtilase family serine protease
MFKYVVVIVTAGLALAVVTPALEAASDRIQGHVESGARSFVLSGNIHPLVASSTDLGGAPASQTLPRIVLTFKMTQQQQADLNNLLAAQQQRSNPQYHKWLTPEEYADRFGLSQNDVDKVSAWLSSMGFSDIEVPRSRTSVSATATVAQANTAFQTSIHRYNRNGVQHVANSSDPVLPMALQGLVSHIRGLNDFHPKPHAVRSPNPHFTSSISGSHFIAPGDFATIYDVQPLYGSGITGAGQVIAIAGQTDIQVSDIEAFQTASGLTVQDPKIVLDGADPGTSSSDIQEADLDIEWAGAVATGATILYVNSQDAFTSATYAIENNLANILSLTYGSCEASFSSTEISSFNSTLQQANAEGMTVLTASGDYGAADCEEPQDPNAPPVTAARQGLAVDFPGSSPSATSAGGTEFNEGAGNYWNTTNGSTGGSAISYIPEIGWNDGVLGTDNEADLAATGGGKSAIFPKPTWQAGNGVPNDGYRDVPDISVAASPDHDGYLVCSQGSCVNGYRMANLDLNVVGGTSVSAPTLAGIVALINQKMGGPQGNINPTIYALASFSTDAFHDITSGNNEVPCVVGTPNCPTAATGSTTGILGYVAGTGYDQVTGLGSIDAYNLANEWNSDFGITISPTSMTVSPGGSGTATVTVNAFGAFSGTVSFSCTVPATLTNTTCSIPGTVTKSGTATLTITDTAAASVHPPLQFWARGPGSGTAALLLLLPALGCFFLLRQKRLRWGFGGGLAVLSLALMTACGGGSSSSGSSSSSQTVTPTVTGTVTITASSGTVKQTANITVTD